MLKFYHESPEFGEYSKIDSTKGRLERISQGEFFQAKGEIFNGPVFEHRTRFPRRIYFQITRKCNLRCPFCFIKADAQGQHVPFKYISLLISFLGKNGLMEVRLSGGEPTLHPSFFNIVKEFQNVGVYVSVATNGLMSKKILLLIKEIKNLYLICSIDGNRETHNSYRPNSFDVIISNLSFLRNFNPALRLRITTVLTKRNKGQMMELGKICRNLGAESITVIPMRPQVRDPKIREEMVSSKEFKKVIEDLVEMKEKLHVSFTTTLETSYEQHIYKDPIYRKKSSCAAGREGTNLDYDFKKEEFVVYGCSYSPVADLEAPSVYRKPFLAGVFKADEPHKFLEIWQDDIRWEIFRNLNYKSEKCQSCEYWKKRCVGSCPIQNIDYTRLNISQGMVEQLKEQINKTVEWYCYQNIEKV